MPVRLAICTGVSKHRTGLDRALSLCALCAIPTRQFDSLADGGGIRLDIGRMRLIGELERSLVVNPVLAQQGLGRRNPRRSTVLEANLPLSCSTRSLWNDSCMTWTPIRVPL